MTGRARPGTVRIIGGEWRGRRLTIPACDEVRPSPDRVRETLFNWLQYSVPGSVCLDLFAGTGVLGFEAASRGARQVTMIDSQPEVVGRLRSAAQQLNTGEKVKIVLADALSWLHDCSGQFDLVFLDPPFRRGLVDAAVGILSQRQLLQPKAQAYIEIEAGITPDVPSHWTLSRTKTAGQVAYFLYTMSDHATQTRDTIDEHHRDLPRNL